MSSELIEAARENSYGTCDFPFLSPDPAQRSDLLDDLDFANSKRIRRHTVLDSTDTRLHNAVETTPGGLGVLERDAVVEEARGKKRARRKTKVKDIKEPQAAQWVIESAEFPPGQVWLEPKPKRKPQPVVISPQQTATDEVVLRSEELTTMGEPLSYDKNQAEIAAIILQKRRENEVTRWRQRMLRQQQRHRREPDVASRVLEARHDELSRRIELSAQGGFEDSVPKGDDEVVEINRSLSVDFGEDRAGVARARSEARTDCDSAACDDRSRDGNESNTDCHAPHTTTTFATRRQSNLYRGLQQTAIGCVAADRGEDTARDTTKFTQPGSDTIPSLQLGPMSSAAGVIPAAPVLASSTPIVVATGKEPQPSNSSHLFDAYRADDEDMLARNLQILSGHSNLAYTPSSAQAHLEFPFYTSGSALHELHGLHRQNGSEGYSAPHTVQLMTAFPRTHSPSVAASAVPRTAADSQRSTTTTAIPAAAEDSIPISTPVQVSDSNVPVQVKTKSSDIHMNMFTGQAREPGVIGGNYTPINNAHRRNMFSNR